MAEPFEGGDPTLTPPKRAPRCPMCGRPREQRYRPFCSAACRDRDLLNWLGGRYAIPAVEIEDDDGEPAPAPQADPE